jgi:hypothetical protein
MLGEDGSPPSHMWSPRLTVQIRSRSNLATPVSAVDAPTPQRSRRVAGRFGYDPRDTAIYNTRFRNPVLANLSAERLQILYVDGGVNAVVGEIERLKEAGII